MDPDSARQHLVGMIRGGEAPAAVLAAADELLGEIDWDAALFSDVGAYASDEGVLNTAIRCFETAADLEPEHPLHHYDLGVALLRQEEFALARRSLERAVALQPFYTGAFVNLLWAYLATGEPVAAYFVSTRLMAFYAGQPRPENVEALLGLVGEWLRTDGLELPRLLTAAMEPLNEGDLVSAHERVGALAGGLEPGTASQAICAEFAATLAFHLDLHTEYLTGMRQRREVVPCAQAFMPSLAVSIMEAGMRKDADRVCHELVRELDPGHVPAGPVMVTQVIGPTGAGAPVFSVLGGAGFHEIVPIGNEITVRAPSGEERRFIDYHGDHSALYTS
ncbi:tetratricopeptide repeat protein [Streptosporangium sp. NPDC002721]|uniref:tetratricopeptide repeat protein n=1 Tax=Streptosporangium sp. NPDC002721 TaxID=3366188 RepID=UPI003673F6A3